MVRVESFVPAAKFISTIYIVTLTDVYAPQIRHFFRKQIKIHLHSQHCVKVIEVTSLRFWSEQHFFLIHRVWYNVEHKEKLSGNLMLKLLLKSLVYIKPFSFHRGTTFSSKLSSRRWFDKTKNTIGRGKNKPIERALISIATLATCFHAINKFPYFLLSVYFLYSK